MVAGLGVAAAELHHLLILDAAEREAHQEVACSHIQHRIHGLVQLTASRGTGSHQLTTQRRLSVWLRRGSIQIATVLFAGVGVPGIWYVLMTWCIEQRWSVFTAGDSCLSVFHEQLYVGRYWLLLKFRRETA